MNIQSNKITDIDVSIPVTMMKSERKATSENYPIRFAISSNNPDRQNERMVIDSVFDKETVDYHMQEGYIDYDHMSFRGDSPFEKAQSIFGKPYDFSWGEFKGTKVAMVEGNLFRGNPYVDQILIPAFDNGNGIFGTSIGGKTLDKSKPKYNSDFGKKVADIYKIKWIHNAITPLYKAVNADTFVENIQKSLEVICHGALCETYQDKWDAIKSFEGLIAGEDTSPLNKGLTANEGNTDYATSTGGAALQPQSLEEDLVMLNRSLLDSCVMELRIGNVDRKLDVLINWFIKRGMKSNVANEYGRAMYDSYPQIMNLKLN